jgi:hypothetical protein
MPYSAKIVRLNAEADPERLGVSLGRLCISRQIPVTQVCLDLDVCKAAVYQWFSGKREVGKHLRLKVAAYYRSRLPPA